MSQLFHIRVRNHKARDTDQTFLIKAQGWQDAFDRVADLIDKRTILLPEPQHMTISVGLSTQRLVEG